MEGCTADPYWCAEKLIEFLWQTDFKQVEVIGTGKSMVIRAARELNVATTWTLRSDDLIDFTGSRFFETSLFDVLYSPATKSLMLQLSDKDTTPLAARTPIMSVTVQVLQSDTSFGPEKLSALTEFLVLLLAQVTKSGLQYVRIKTAKSDWRYFKLRRGLFVEETSWSVPKLYEDLMPEEGYRLDYTKTHPAFGGKKRYLPYY